MFASSGIDPVSGQSGMDASRPEAAKAMAPAPGKQEHPGHDKAEAEQQRVATDAPVTKLLSEEVYPERLVDDVWQRRPDRHQAIVCWIYSVARSPSGGDGALQMAQQRLAGRSGAQNNVSEREHAVISSVITLRCPQRPRESNAPAGQPVAPGAPSALDTFGDR